MYPSIRFGFEDWIYYFNADYFFDTPVNFNSYVFKEI